MQRVTVGGVDKAMMRFVDRLEVFSPACSATRVIRSKVGSACQGRVVDDQIGDQVSGRLTARTRINLCLLLMLGSHSKGRIAVPGRSCQAGRVGSDPK